MFIKLIQNKATEAAKNIAARKHFLNDSLSNNPNETSINSKIRVCFLLMKLNFT